MNAKKISLDHHTRLVLVMEKLTFIVHVGVICGWEMEDGFRGLENRRLLLGSF